MKTPSTLITLAAVLLVTPLTTWGDDTYRMELDACVDAVASSYGRYPGPAPEDGFANTVASENSDTGGEVEAYAEGILVEERGAAGPARMLIEEFGAED